MSTVTLLTTVASLISFRSSSCSHVLFVAKIFEDHVDVVHVSNAQNPVYRLRVNEIAVLPNSEFCLRGY